MLNTARNNCVNSLKKAVRMDNKNPQYWGALGTAAATDAIDLKPLAQHSFIRSLELDPYSATYWVNLGVFYLKQGNSMLANQSFKRAEATDPTIPNIWTGQGLIAEQVGHVTMLEMLSHSTKLGYEPVGMISYGYHVVDRYVNESSLPEEERINAEIDIPRAADAMTIYAVTHPNDPCGWNLLGILRQTEKQYKSATKAFQTAQSCLDAGNDNKKKVEVNIRRCQQLLESTKMSTMDIPDFTDSGQLELYRWKHVYPWLIRG